MFIWSFIILYFYSHSIHCLEHRSYSSHACPNTHSKDSQVIICPICADAIKLDPFVDANVTWLQHSKSGKCDSSKAPGIIIIIIIY